MLLYLSICSDTTSHHLNTCPYTRIYIMDIHVYILIHKMYTRLWYVNGYIPVCLHKFTWLDIIVDHKFIVNL